MAHPAPTPNVAPNAEVGWTEPYSKLIFENAAIGIALVDLEGRPIAANAALQRMLGYTESELQARTFPEFTFPDDVTSDWTLFEELLAGTRQSYQIEKRYVRKDGSLVWGRLNASMVLGGPDGTSHCVGILEDITEQKSADEDRARLAAIVTSSHDAIIGQRLDGAIASWNPAAERLFGYAADEVLGRSLAFLVPADRQDEWAANMDRVRSGEQIEAYETTRVCKDGRCVQVSLSVSPIVDQRVQVVGFSSIARDITARQRSDAALRASEERFRLQYHGIPIPTYSWRHTGDDFVLEAFNAASDAITEGGVRTWIGRRASELYGDNAMVLSSLRTCLNDRRTIRHEMPYRSPTTGRERQLSVSYVFVPPDLVMAHTEDITERKQADAELRQQALHDGLTGLPNRGLLRAELQQALADERDPGRQAALLLLDLDRFKEVNDTLGHPAGDHLLQQISRRLSGAVRHSDLVARLGGDEFALLLPSTDATGALHVAEVVADALQTPFLLEGQLVAVDASIGIAVTPEHGRDADTLLRCADVAMYKAKRSGVGVALYRAADDDHCPDRLALLGELRNAIDHNELLLHYQPKLDLRDGTVVGVEALVRWQHPQRGFLPPSAFIPLAEQSGLIYPLSRWVLDAALRQQQIWQGKGIDIPVAVNLPRRMLHDPQLPETVAQSLARWDVAPARLVLEITESSLMADPVRAGENLSELRALGVRISIDDFGTGYSSLASLKNLPVDELKIDQSFVQAMATDASSRAIVRAIVDLADALKLRVVAEGVEDRATWNVLAGLGCEVAQGYFLSRPIAPDDFEAWVAQVGPSWLVASEGSRADEALQDRIRGRGERLTAEEEFVGRKRAEAALSASEERNRLALQAAGMGTWDVNAINDVHTWSTEAEALSGLAPGTFEGTFAAFRRSVHPDDWPAFEIEERAAHAEHRDSVTRYRAVWPDGSLRWMEARGRALYAADGTPVRMTDTTMDITKRMRSEEALRASEERLRSQYKGFPLPTYSWVQVGEDFVLKDFNDAAETVTEGHIVDGLGRTASEFFAHNPQIPLDLRACAAEQRTLKREMQCRHQTTGLMRQLVLSFVFVPPQTVMVHTEDVTEARHAELQRDTASGAAGGSPPPRLHIGTRRSASKPQETHLALTDTAGFTLKP
jgi:diguanylate cyclase (GGDEF)-like protein/PAS domain S-box-containing protein